MRTLSDIIDEIKKALEQRAKLRGEYWDAYSDERGNETLFAQDEDKLKKVNAEQEKLDKQIEELKRELREKDSFEVKELAKLLAKAISEKNKQKSNIVTSKEGKRKLTYVNVKEGKSYLIGISDSQRGLFDRDVELNSNTVLDCLCFVPYDIYRDIVGGKAPKNLDIYDAITQVFQKLSGEKVIVDDSADTVKT